MSIALAKIMKRGNKFILMSKDGKKKLGTFNSMREAKQRERQIQFFKNRKK